MKKISLISHFALFYHCYSQELNGKIESESLPTSQVLVINTKSHDRTYSNSLGHFKIDANFGDEIRFVQNGYERKSIQYQNSEEIIIKLKKLIAEIPEVEIKKKLTGKLDSDSKLLNENKKKNILNNDIKAYFKTKSSEELLKPKLGEFVQPVGSSISLGSIDNKWVVTDLVEWIKENFTNDYFLSLGLKLEEIYRFILQSLTSFDKAIILKYGYCNSKDVGNLKIHFETSFKKLRNKVHCTSINN